MSTTEYTITGTVAELTETKIEREYHERTIVVGTGGRYPKTLAVRFSDKSGETAGKLDRVGVGDRVTVTFDVSSRKGKGGDRWFTSADGWACDVIERKSNGARAAAPASTRGDYDGPPPPDDDDYPPGLR